MNGVCPRQKDKHLNIIDIWGPPKIRGSHLPRSPFWGRKPREKAHADGQKIKRKQP